MRPLVFMLVLLTAGELLAEDEPLHQVIDKHLAAAGDEAPVCRDAEFLRRVSLDLIGLPPTADEVRAGFLPTAGACVPPAPDPEEEPKMRGAALH